MNCEEFQKIVERDPSRAIDLDVEMDAHVKKCTPCGKEFESLREISRRLAAATRSSAEFQIDPAFSIGLERRLKAEFLAADSKDNSSKLSWLRIFVPAMAVLVLALGVGVLFINKTSTGEVANSFLSKGLAEIGTIVAGNHVYCTLERLGMWETLAHTDYPDKAKYTETVVAALKANYSEGVQLISVHDCAFEGKDFRHVILRNGSEVVSVFLDKSDVVAPGKENLTRAIVSGVEDGFQIASFTSNERLVFIVSKLSETENLTIARSLTYSLGQI